MTDEQRDQDEQGGAGTNSPTVGRTGRLSISPRLTYLLIGAAAIGLIVLMCLVVALVALLQNS